MIALAYNNRHSAPITLFIINILISSHSFQGQVVNDCL